MRGKLFTAAILAQITMGMYVSAEAINMPVYTLDEVVVTATRMKDTIQTAPASVNVITADQIKEKRVNTITEAIGMLPGVYNARPQGMSDVGNGIQIRGYGESDILVQYDGMVLNDGYEGGVNWNAVAIDDVEKIEIVKGAASSLYGGRAVGAVINITSKDPEKNRTKLYSSYGSHATWKSGINVSRKINDKLSASFGYERRQTHGHLKKYVYTYGGDKDSPSGKVGTGLIQTEKYSGSKMYLLGIPGTGASKDNTYNLKMKYKFNENKSLTYRFTHDDYKYYAYNPVSYIHDAAGHPLFEGSVQSPDGKWYNFDESDFTDYYGRRKIDVHAFNYKDDDNKIVFNLGLTNVKDSGYSTGYDLAGDGKGGDAKYPNKTYKADLQKEWDFGKNNMVAGIDFQRDSMDYIKSKLAHWHDKNSVTSQTMKMGGKNELTALFLQDKLALDDKWSMYAGLRWDHYRKHDGYYKDSRTSISQENSTYNELSPKLSFEFLPDSNTTIYASYGHSFNAPTLYQMYRHDPNYGYIANPDLEPETTNTFEIGIKKKLGTRTAMTFDVYAAKTKDMISAIKLKTGPNKGKRQYVNLSEVKRRGAEFDIAHSFDDKWSGYINYAYQTAEDGEGERIYSIPRHVLHSGIRYDKNKWNGYLEGQYISDRNEPGDLAHRMYSEDSVFTINLGANYEFAPGASVGLSIDNLLDKDYWQWQHSSGREYTLSLSYEF